MEQNVGLKDSPTEIAVALSGSDVKCCLTLAIYCIYVCSSRGKKVCEAH
jgi:hypothetical protein